MVIRLMERAGLVTSVKWPSPERVTGKLAATAGTAGQPSA
jgi:hypothetical protein